MISLTRVEHQLGLSGSETIWTKQNYEKMVLEHGVLINCYKADNGVFKANIFGSHIREHNQKLSYCGVNAHHKKDVVECAIHTVSKYARALILHAMVR